MSINKIFKYVVFDTIRNKLVLGYCSVFMLLGFSFFYLGQDSAKSLVSLLNIVLLIVPLVSIVIGSIHYYNSREFMEVLLAQPVQRGTVFWGEYLGLSASLSFACTIGIGVPIVAYGLSIVGVFLLAVSVLLSFAFVALSFLIAVLTNDKARGIGGSILLWFYFSVLYDGLVLLVLFFYNDYPLDTAMLLMTALNPIDTGRIIVLLQMDISALMGVTGAVFEQFFGTFQGVLIAVAAMGAWIAVPAWSAYRLFLRKDF